MLLVDGVVNCSSDTMELALRAEGSHLYLDIEGAPNLSTLRDAPFARISSLRTVSRALRAAGLQVAVRRNGAVVATIGYGVHNDMWGKVFRLGGARFGKENSSS